MNGEQMNVESSGFSKKPKVFYGYWVLMATFFCLFITAGCGMFAFSLFVKPLQAELGWGRGEIMVAFTIFFSFVGASAPFIGRIIDRFPAKKVIALGAFVTGLGFVSASQMNSLWHYYLSYAVVGVGVTTMGHIPSTTVVSNWFEKRRGTAIGILSTGVGAGGLVMAPIIGGYLIPNFGWRASYLIMAILIWVLVIPLALFVIKSRPSDMGLFPDGETAPTATETRKAARSTAAGLTLRLALATSALWLVIVSYPIGNFSQVGVLQSIAPHLQDIGIPAALAAGALSGFGLGSLIGKFFFGWLCDRILPKYSYAIGLGVQVIGIAIFSTIGPASPYPLIWLTSVILGLAAGSWLPTMSMNISTNFGLVSYGSIYGVVSLAMSIGTATGPLLAGYMFDATGNYHTASLILIALHAVSISTILAVRRPKVHQSL